VQRFLRDESGATAIEYGLLAAMIAIFLVSIAATGGAVDQLYQTILSIADAMGGAGEDG
jgi:pilus assembly protein Flp/PilA